MFRAIGWHFARISLGALIIVVGFYNPTPNLNQQKSISPKGEPSAPYDIGQIQAQSPSAFHDQAEDQVGRAEKEKECDWGNPAGPCLVKWFDTHSGTVSALATVVIAAFTWSLATSTRRLWKAGEDQLRTAQQSADTARDASITAIRTMVAAHRAWIRVNITRGVQPLFFSNGFASKVLSIEIMNTGNAPATNITPHLWLATLNNSGVFPWDAQRTRCDGFRSLPVTGGFTLFPGEVFPESINRGSYGETAVLTQEELAGAALGGKQNSTIKLYVVGCIDYTFPTDPDVHHQTGFLYEITRLSAPHYIRISDAIIDGMELSLEEDALGRGRHAD